MYQMLPETGRAIIHGIDTKNALQDCDSSRLELPQNRDAQRVLRLQPPGRPSVPKRAA